VTTPLTHLTDLRGQRAVVTGGARGIGQAVVARLAEAGAEVTVVDLAPRPPDAPVAEWHQADVGDGDAARRIVAGGPAPSVLVNCAGAYPLVPFDDLDEAGWDLALRTNLTSVGHYSRAAAGRMRAAGIPGAIVNITSVAGIRPVPMLVHYGTAKAAVRHLTRALAAEYGPHGIRVNAVSPGGIPTEGAAAARVEASAAPSSFARPPRPLGETGTPDDVARAVLFLASAWSRYITGAELVVDGGTLLV
jgi:NAD(P)-dependent dehydrogenase (short-subunit alcohol dehydrogenase family)